MKALNKYINEKLVLNKDTFKKHYNYFPNTKEELIDIINQLLYERKDNDIIDLNDIDTSEITDMSYLFSAFNIKNIDISKWNVSKVIDMHCMFDECTNLEYIGNISKWNVSKVKNMSYMFYKCENLESLVDLSNWKTSKVKNIVGMFFGCTKLKSIGNISDWDVSNIENMSDMFYNCKNLISIGNISNWNISNVTNMADMFTDSGITNLPAWYKE